jgi:transposase
MKQSRRIATRHDKLAASYLTFVQLAFAACVCLHDGFLT